jgi:hypothetical protein
MGYSDAHVENSTKYAATGQVVYSVCSDDSFNISAGDSWSHSRGICLIKKVTAQLSVNGQFVSATPYTSSGTSYSQFIIFEKSDGTFAVTRDTSDLLDADTGEILEVAEGSDPRLA